VDAEALSFSISADYELVMERCRTNFSLGLIAAANAVP